MLYSVVRRGGSCDVVRVIGNVAIFDRSWCCGTEFYFSVKPSFLPRRIVIPGVVYWFDGFDADNIFALPRNFSFREDRCSIPSACVVEDDENVVGVFVEPAKNEDELSSITIRRGVISIRIPWSEEPLRYISKRRFGGPIKKFFSRPTQYSRRFYVVSANYRDLGYSRGYHLFLREAWRILGQKENLDVKRAYKFLSRRVEYALRVHYFRLGYISSFLNYVFVPTPIASSSVSGGFIGRSVEMALALYRLYLAGWNEKFREIAINTANFHCNGFKRGLLLSDYSIVGGRWLNSIIPGITRVNVRQVAEECYNLLRLYSIAKKDDANPVWLNIARRVADFFVENQKDDGSFGRWIVNNRLVGEGTNGAYVIWLLSKLYEVLGTTDYLRSAERGMKYYYQNYVSKDIYLLDTLDAATIDKEGAHAVMRSGLMLYRLTNKKEYLSIAERAAYFILTWMMMWNVPFKKDTVLGKIGFSTFGWTSVSVEHQHLDPYGLIMAPDFFSLYKYTKDTFWSDIGVALVNAIVRFIFPLKGVGAARVLYGYQPEQIYHTDWTYMPTWITRLVSIFMFGRAPRSLKGYIFNSVMWSIAGPLNALLDVFGIVGVGIPKNKNFPSFSMLTKFFRGIRNIFAVLNVFL